ncbi:MAG TPA: shikimate kinase [Nitrospirota bacterium]|nr:shikimate kinase [Nitrospirota bacterium]
MFKNIILTGFMGVGKTSVGTGLAKDVGYQFVDTDLLIEADQKMSVTEIFSTKGEPFFREVESRVIGEVLQRESQVVSTGGGAVLRDSNREAFKKAGFVVCLTARPEVIFERVRHETHRPLLRTEDPLAKIGELLESRAPFYAQADAVIDTSEKSVEAVITEIKEKIRYAYC